MKLIDFPKYIPLSEYEKLKTKLVDDLAKHPEILSIYQLGSVKNSGISDLDLLCVFKSNIPPFKYQLPNLSKDEKYILTHSLFGIHENNFHLIQKFVYQSSFVLLYGKDLLTEKKILPIEIKQQIALEYLFVFYISLSRQLINNTIKLRTFLLEAKAIEFDLELLSIKSLKINNLVDEVKRLRNEYFEIKHTKFDLINLIKNFHKAIEELLHHEFKKITFFSPKKQFNISKNIQITQGNELKILKEGVFLPKFLSFSGKYHMKINHKIGKLKVFAPFEVSTKHATIIERFELIKKIQDDQLLNLPGFIPLTSKLNFFYENNPLYR